MTFVDLAGQRFGRLIVVGRAPASHKWLSECDCGDSAFSTTWQLKSGNTLSCGCLRKETDSARSAAMLEDLTGQRFGQLVAVERSENLADKTTWLCQCDCGRSAAVRSALLKKGTTTSCGCKRRNHPDHVGYGGAHFRVKSAKGKASSHACVDCGRPAFQWSYSHDDPNELLGAQGFPYSQDPSHYVPRCRSCHRVYDNQATKAIALANTPTH